MTKASTTLRSVPSSAATGDIEVYAARWRRELKASSRSERTITDYLRTLDYFDAFLAERGLPRFVGEISREDIEAFRDHFLTATHPDGKPYSPASAKAYAAAIKSFFRWLADDLPADDGIPTNVAEKVKLPIVHVKVMEVPKREAIDKVMNTTRGTTFRDRRDRAILGVLMSSGVRESGLTGIRMEDLHLDDGYAVITLKGGDEHRIRLDPETVKDLDRYLAVRSKHAYASSPYLWLGRRGKMGTSGIYQMLQRRAEAVGVELSIHDFRRFVASELLSRGASVDDTMTLMGWRDRSMPARYAAFTADERAAAVHAKLNPRSADR